MKKLVCGIFSHENGVTYVLPAGFSKDLETGFGTTIDVDLALHLSAGFTEDFETGSVTKIDVDKSFDIGPAG